MYKTVCKALQVQGQLPHETDDTLDTIKVRLRQIRYDIKFLSQEFDHVNDTVHPHKPPEDE